MHKKITLVFSFLTFLSVAAWAQPTAFTCPISNVAVLRAGTSGATTNPISIYNIDNTTAAASFLSGPILDPASPTTNLQVDGIGLNAADGFLYGLFSDSPPLSFTPATPFYRIGANAQAVQLGTLAGPTPTGGDNASFVIPLGAEFDQSDTYYFGAVTGFINLNLANLPASTFTPSTFYIGSLASPSTLTAGTAALSPTYVAITNPGNDAANYLTYASQTINASAASSLGLQDVMHNTVDGSLYTYVTWPNGSSGYFGQMLRINPSTGVLTAVAPPATQSFITSTVYPNGMMQSWGGDFLVMMTNGDIYEADGTVFAYTGGLTLLNGATALPNPLRGDMATCGIPVGPLPLPLRDFSVIKKHNSAVLSWKFPEEKNTVSYEIEYWTDNTTAISVGTLAAQAAAEYSFTHENGLQLGVNYYRIKMNHTNGKASYSAVKTIQMNPTETLVYPNPAREDVHIILAQNMVGTDIQLMMVNQLGQTILKNKIENAEEKIMLNLSALQLNSGLYYLSILDSSGLPISQHKLQYLR